jgi:hypothetical protein
VRLCESLEERFNLGSIARRTHYIPSSHLLAGGTQ